MNRSFAESYRLASEIAYYAGFSDKRHVQLCRDYMKLYEMMQKVLSVECMESLSDGIQRDPSKAFELYEKAGEL